MTCTCPHGGGDGGPMIWHCPEHGFTGLMGFSIRFNRQSIFKDEFDFWCFCMGVLKSEQAVARHTDKIYYDEDYLWHDVDAALTQLQNRWLAPIEDALQKKLDYLLEIQSGFRQKKANAVTKGVIYLIDKEVTEVKDRIRKLMLRK